MVRKIIKIDEDRCIGCGLCAKACHEGAIEMIDGKAKLTKENYCDGLGDCLPVCPADAIHFEEREAPAYDEEAVKLTKQKKEAAQMQAGPCASQLSNWPVQIKLAPVRSPYFAGADLLIAADCTAFSYGNFHHDFIRGRVTLIGCPKLDMCDYAEKLTQILMLNDIRSITVTCMEVPCCGGMSNAVKRAAAASGKEIPVEIVVISAKGEILKRG